MSPSARLAELGINLPEVAAPLAAYVPAVRTGNLVYTAGQLPLARGELTHAGKVGAEVSPEQAQFAARTCALNALAAAHDLLVVEDAAEAHGAAVHGARVGSLGRVGAFSFYANKIITTGEGGMLTTDDGALAARCRMLRDHAMPPAQRYWHDEVGFNYRLTNLQAAVGVAQLEQIDTFLARKRHIAAQYTAALADVPGLTPPVELPGYTNVYWMVSVLVTDAFPLTRDELMAALRARDIDSRPFFHPLDTLPPYRAATPCPVALDVARRGLNLPSSAKLTDAQVAYICGVLRELAA